MRFHNVLWQILWCYKIIAVTPKQLLKTHFFEKNGKFSSEKRSWPTFSGNVEHDKCQGVIYKVPEGLLTVFAQGFFGTSEFVRKKRSEKRFSPSNKRFRPFFSRNIDCDKPHGTIYKGPKGLLDIFVKLQDHETFLKKSCFSNEKKIGRIYLVWSSMDDTRQPFIRLHKVFWQSLCRWKYHFCNKKRLLKTQLFEESKNCTETEYFATVFSYYRVWQTSGSNFYCFARPCVSYCERYNIISLGRRRLVKTKIFEKGKNCTEIGYFGIFFSYYRVWQTSGSNL